VKNPIEFKRGVSTIKVELGEIDGEWAVFKHLKTESKFLRELEAYKKLQSCTITPRLKHYSLESKLIVTEYVGKSLNLKYPPAERKKFKPRIQMMNHELITDYGIHHNDIRWKNVVESDNGNLFLIDFECWTPTSLGSRERDPERILLS
jgi:RIO-like serine/threonine protein kinase